MPVGPDGQQYTVDPNTGQTLLFNANGVAGPGSPQTQPAWLQPNGAAPSQTAAPSAPGGGQWQLPPGANPTDPAVVQQFVQFLSQQPGADPSLAADPNYWVQKIIQTGGATNDVAGAGPGAGQNIGYWMDKSKAGGGSGGAGGGAGGFNFDPNNLNGNPGYQFALKEALNATQQGNAAKGIALSTGGQKDLQDRASGVAAQWEPALFGQALQGFQTNFSNLGSLTDLGQKSATEQGSYITGGASADAAGSVAQGNIWSGATSNIANTATNAYIYNQLKNGQGGSGAPPFSGYDLGSPGAPAELGGGG